MIRPRLAKKLASSKLRPFRSTERVKEIGKMTDGHLLWEWNQEYMDELLDLMNICKKVGVEVEVVPVKM